MFRDIGITTRYKSRLEPLVTLDEHHLSRNSFDRGSGYNSRDSDTRLLPAFFLRDFHVDELQDIMRVDPRSMRPPLGETQEYPFKRGYDPHAAEELCEFITRGTGRVLIAAVWYYGAETMNVGGYDLTDIAFVPVIDAGGGDVDEYREQRELIPGEWNFPEFRCL